LVCFALMANAHTYLTNLTINGTLLDEGKCIRPPWENENFPVKDVTSKDLLCRTKSMTVASADICGIQAGSNITVDLHESGPGSRALSESHRGPCIVYMAPLDSNGDGPVWFKIYEDGWDKAADTWCVNTLIANKGKLEVTIPRDIAPGNYLLRTEVIALHEANRVYGADESAGAELFPNCAQLAVYGTGTVHPSGVNIPGIYDKTQPGLHYDLWGDSTTYEIPGPTLY
ncbi:glycoside hydrolase, partial [Coemansia spiralis]